jgi:GTPase SAR1 family protein
VTLDDKIHELLIVDTAGAQEYDELRRDAIKDAHGIIIVYSIQKAREFSRVEEIHGTLEEMYQQWNMPPIVLVGTGIDRESSRAIPFMQGLNMARKLGCGFCECSSRDGRNVEEPFMQIIRQLQTPVDKNPEMSQKDTSPGMKLLGWEHV